MCIKVICDEQNTPPHYIFNHQCVQLCVGSALSGPVRRTGKKKHLVSYRFAELLRKICVKINIIIDNNYI